MNDVFKFVTVTDKFFLKQYLKEGDLAIDMTCGNGNDTIFLSDCVGDTGKVYSFEIQENVLKENEKGIINRSSYKNIIFINDNHANVEEYVKPNSVRAIVFNLGFYPGDKTGLTTKKETTLEAIKKSLSLLKSEGIITICVYPHKEGKEEKEALLDFVKTLSNEYNAYEFKRLNRNDPPYIIFITKD